MSGSAAMRCGDQRPSSTVAPSANRTSRSGRPLTPPAAFHLLDRQLEPFRVAELLAHFAAQRGLRRVAIYYLRNTYGRELANAFEERANEIGVTIVARQSYDPSDQATARTFEPIVKQWKTLDMDAIFLAGEVPSAGFFIAKAREQGLKVPIFGGDAMSSPA